MTDSIVTKRLLRNLRYKLTYIQIFEDYMEPDPGPGVMALLQALIEAQHSAIAPLSSYLRGLDVNTQDLELDERLLSHAENREGLKARLRFIHDGLHRSAAWYKMQMTDKQMTADLELAQLLLELGEIDAAKLWRTETVMASLKISVKFEEKEWDSVAPQPERERKEGWRPRLVEDVGRPSWSGGQSTEYPRPERPSWKGRSEQS